MERCSYCDFGHPNHDVACPRNDPARQALYEKGWTAGRTGKDFPESADPTFILGWVKGEATLETAENTCRDDYY